MSEDGFFSTVLESKDGIDRKIQFSTVAMIMSLGIDNFMFADKNLWNNYFGKIVNLARSLLKVNDHYRKYISEEEKFLKDFKNKCLSESNNSHSQTSAVSLSTELDGFLSHFKSGLDTLATSLNPLLSLNLNGWHKERDNEGIKRSGAGIIKCLENNLDNSLKGKSKPLIDYIKDNIEYITYIVDLRDKVHHHGGLKEVTDITYNFKTKEIIPQLIMHPDGSSESIRDFMSRSIFEFIDYFNCILCLSLEIKAPGNDMVIAKNPKNEFPHYQWVIKVSSIG